LVHTFSPPYDRSLKFGRDHFWKLLP
jgi:hypothetical protein